jgi:hypothetical protein
MLSIVIKERIKVVLKKDETYLLSFIWASHTKSSGGGLLLHHWGAVHCTVTVSPTIASGPCSLVSTVLINKASSISRASLLRVNGSAIFKLVP